MFLFLYWVLFLISPKVSYNLMLFVASHKTRESTSRLLVEQCNILNFWFSANGLKLNPEKTQLLNFHLNHQNNYLLNNLISSKQFNIPSHNSVLFLRSSSLMKRLIQDSRGRPSLKDCSVAIELLSYVVGFQTLKQVFWPSFQSHISFGQMQQGCSRCRRR